MNQKIAVSAVYMAATFMCIMDSTIVNVAVPTIGREFHVRADSVDAVSIAYLVSFAVFIPVSGWLGDRVGGRRVLLASIVVFTVASALCGLADNLGELVGFRVLQGLGGGLMLPVGMAMAFRSFSPAERVKVSSILVIPSALAPAVGPVLGGVFVTEISWRWVFYINVPVGLAAWGFGVAFLEAHRGVDPGRLDVAGFLLSAIGLGLLMYGIAEGPFEGWGRPLIVAPMAGGAVLLGSLVVVELRIQDPLIDMRLFSDRLFRSATVVLALGLASFLGMLFLVALFFQDGLGRSALQSGLSTFPEAVGVMLGAQIATRWLYPTLGPRRVMLSGLVVMAGALALMCLIGTAGELWWLRLLLFVAGYGVGHVFTTAQVAGFARISPADTARASTVFNAARQLSGAVGVAVLSTVVAEIGPTRRVGGSARPYLAAYHVAFLVAAAIAVVAAAVSLVIDDADAAPSLRAHADDVDPAPQPQSAAGR